MSKLFLIVDDDHPQVLCEYLTKKAFQFLSNKFGEVASTKVEVNAEGLSGGEFSIELKFKDFMCFMEEGGFVIDSITLILSDEGLQPLYVNGEYVTKNILAFSTGMPLRCTNDVYGFNADDVYNEFEEYMLTC